MKSFYAPYLCEHCKTSFQAIIDAYAHREAIESRTPPSMPCPNCQRRAIYDGEPAAFVAAAEKISPSAGGRLAPSVALDPTGPRLERHNEGSTTRIALIGELGPSVKWRNAMDGIGSSLVVDLSRATTVTAGGLSPLVTALRSVEVTSIEITSCPMPLAEGLRGVEITTLRVRSISIDGHCASCKQLRRATIEVTDGAWERTVTTKITKAAACPKCGSALTTASTASDVPQRTLPFGLMIGSAAALALIGLLVVLVGLVMSLVPPTGGGEMPGAKNEEEMPSVEPSSDRLKLGPEQVSATGHGGPYATASEAEASARDKALGTIISALGREIATKRGISAGAVEISQAEVAAFLAALSLDPATLRVDGDVTEGPSGFEVNARYALSRPTFDRIVADYSGERQWEGLKLVRPFPPASGLRVVESDVANLEPGTRIIRIGETVLSNLGDLPPSGMIKTLVIQEPDGTERTITF